jgi:hypothetical protein
MYKKINLKAERASLQLRWEVTNVFNTPFLGTPDVYIDDIGTFMDPTKNTGITARGMTSDFDSCSSNRIREYNNGKAGFQPAFLFFRGLRVLRVPTGHPLNS